MQFGITQLKDIDQEEFIHKISGLLVFEIVFPLSSIGFTQSPSDIVQDYAEVSFCAESIAPFIRIINSQIVTGDKNYKEFIIKCEAKDITGLTEKLYLFSNILSGESAIYDDIDKFSFMDEVLEYTEQFYKKVFYFPELINNYWANLINGAYWEISGESDESEREFFNNIYRKYPEQRYGFWKNPLTESLKEPLYFSTENWIIPPNTDIAKCLQKYSGIEHILLFEKADKIDFEERIVLVSNSTAVYFTQFEELKKSISCVERVLAKKFSKSRKVEHVTKQVNLFGEVYTAKKRERVDHTHHVPIDESKISYRVSEVGDIIIAEYQEFSHIFFAYESLTFEAIKSLNSFLHPIYSKTQNLVDISIAGKCNWGELNDDTFEELCYDILYCHPRFDSSTIKKMGKSRSRDGGRDITIKSKRTPTREQELYIFQCKYLSGDTSLSASKVSNASNVIVQYGAKGYGVFTSSVIDATLYDMLDGFKRNLEIDTSFSWSMYELERYLNRNQILKNKYFKVLH
jgi:hypothetical protein